MSNRYRSWRFIRLVLIFTLTALSACSPRQGIPLVTPTPASENSTPSPLDETNDSESNEDSATSTNPSPFVTSEVAKLLQMLYIGGDIKQYRITLFILYQEMQFQDADTIALRLSEMFDYAVQNGADGLEPLILTYADALNSIGTEEHLGTIATKLQLAKAKLSYISYKMATPYLNVAMPLGRFSTPFVLDVRADAARVLMDQWMIRLMNTPNGKLPFGSLGYEEIVRDKETTNKLCEMPELKDDAGNVPDKEKRRKEFCDPSESSGSGSGSISSGLGPMALAQCYNPTPQSSYTDQQRLNDFKTCEEDMARARADGNPLAAGPLIVIPIVIAGVGVLTGIASLGYKIYKDAKDESLRLEKEGAEAKAKAAEAKAKAEDDLHSAIVEYATAESERNKAAIDLERKENDVTSALKEIADDIKEYGSEGSNERPEKNRHYQDAVAERKKASEDLKAKETILKEKQEAKETAKTRATEAGVEVDETPKPDTNTTMPVENPLGSPACVRAMAGTNDPEDLAKFGLITPEYFEMMSCIHASGMPDPDSPGCEVMSTPQCGLDDNTWGKAKAEGLRCSLMMCSDGFSLTDSCSCEPSRPDFDLAAAQQDACSRTIYCPDSEPIFNGGFCSCSTSGSSEAPPIPPIPPIDLWRTPRTIDYYFEVLEPQDSLTRALQNWLIPAYDFTNLNPIDNSLPTESRWDFNGEERLPNP